MRDKNVFNIKRCLPRMSWSYENLYAVWARSLDRQHKVSFRKTTKSLFQQRWTAKSLIRAYHGDFIPEKIFKRWYLPSNLPDVRPRLQTSNAATQLLDDFAGRKEQVDRAKRQEEEEDKQKLAPVGSLMLAEIERRIDVFIFRCCFASSVYEARRLVIHGHVLLNGKKHSDANTRLAPGDMVTVDPAAIRFLQKPKPGQVETADVSEAVEDSEAAEDVEASEDAEASETLEQAVTDSEVSESDVTSGQPDGPSDLTPFHLPPYASPFIFLPAYAEVSFLTCSAVYVRHPTARPGYSEIPTPYDADGEIVRLAWEWYAQRRSRNRSKSQLARLPPGRDRQVGGV